jgi:hypothetical protein
MVRLGIRIRRSDIEKARRNLSKLTTKVITDKNGHRRTVYVRLGLPVNGNLKAGKDGKVEAPAGKKDTNWYTHQLTTEELKEFIVEAKKGKENKNAFIGIVKTEAAQQIKAICGKVISKIMLESGAVRHSLGKIHHNLEEDDLLYAVEVINNPISIEVSPTKHRDSEVLSFKGNVNGEIYFLEAVRPKHKGWLSLVTCYRPKKAGQGSDAAETAPQS